MADRFQLCLPFVLAQECNAYTGTDADWVDLRNYDKDPRDSGGATMCGITHYDVDEYCEAHNLATMDVRHMGKTIGLDIYQNRYWFPFCPRLPPGLDLFFFDTNVNMGHRAVRLLQASLEVTVDGGWGPKTQAAVDALKDVAAVIRDEENRRAAAYRSFRAFPTFGKDWLRRDREIGAYALKMVEK